MLWILLHNNRWIVCCEAVWSGSAILATAWLLVLLLSCLTLFLSFLARDSIMLSALYAIARPPVRLFVCLSVRLVPVVS